MTLDQYLSRNGITTPTFARTLGMDASAVWRIRYDKVRPDWKTVEAIVRATSGAVMANDFLRATSRNNSVADKKQG